MAPSEQRTSEVNINMQTQGDHKPEEQDGMEGRGHMVLSWKVIRNTLLSIETDLVQAQERSLLLAQSSSCLIAATRMCQSAVPWWEKHIMAIWEPQARWCTTSSCPNRKGDMPKSSH